MLYKCYHNEKTCEGTHKHIDAKDGIRKTKYLSIASSFTDISNWTNNVFYKETDVNVNIGISGTIAARKSIFWKETVNRLCK